MCIPLSLLKKLRSGFTLDIAYRGDAPGSETLFDARDIAGKGLYLLSLASGACSRKA